MTTFQETREQTEQQVMVHLLGEIERNASFTQRGAAQELGIALGLMNQYLKRCIAKGWVRASKVSPRRISYFLTPEGFAQKSAMVARYLSKSLDFFREAREQCEQVLAFCRQNQWANVAIVGSGELVEIMLLVGRDSGIELTMIQLNSTSTIELQKFEAVIIADIKRPQQTYDQIVEKFPGNRILTLSLLHISRNKVC